MAKDISFLGLNRPEYPPLRELFMSELAWSIYRASGERGERRPGFAGYAYRELSSKKEKGFEFTLPSECSKKFDQLRSYVLSEREARTEEEATRIVNILLSELEAPYSNKALRTAATPLGLQTALLQDLRGITGKNNPANLALILEQMYALGGGKSSMAGQWSNAMTMAQGGGMPTWIEEFYAQVLPADLADVARSVSAHGPRHSVEGLRTPKWLSSLESNPFKWFANSWDRLCENGWIDTMPRRRWTDWAACVARTGLACGYMFEMHLYRRLGAALISDDAPEDVVRQLLDDGKRLFSWDDQVPRSAADVGPVVTQLASAGSACMKLIHSLVSDEDLQFPAMGEYDSDPNGLVSWLVAARAARDSVTGLQGDVARALAAKKVGPASNTWEMIRYSLLSRASDGEQDLYGVLRSAGRYTWVEPGQEWLVTVSSLQAESPGKLSRLTDLSTSLSALGIDASQRTIVSRLEAYGLARSSHDADDALEIMPGF
ncbi:hypothetical protein [Roseovarius sp.]|uniref:hypothetical protein n=1 Tax=Roseovarius sp. TaxID=1486281 RepID=UPI003B5B594F